MHCKPDPSGGSASRDTLVHDSSILHRLRLDNHSCFTYSYKLQVHLLTRDGAAARLALEKHAPTRTSSWAACAHSAALLVYITQEGRFSALERAPRSRPDTSGASRPPCAPRLAHAALAFCAACCESSISATRQKTTMPRNIMLFCLSSALIAFWLGRRCMLATHRREARCAGAAAGVAASLQRPTRFERWPSRR